MSLVSTTNAGNAITIVDLNRPLNYYTNGLNIAANTVSTSSTTGALTVAGGVGIQGNLYVNGDIFGNVTLTDISVNTVTAVGNVVGGNLLASGNITGGNVLGGANVNAITHTGTTVSVSANITGGNILSGAVLSAVGNATILSGTAIISNTHSINVVF
jgi:hypothetical protein